MEYFRRYVSTFRVPQQRWKRDRTGTNENEGGSRFNSRPWASTAYSEVLRRMPARCYAKTARAGWSALSIFRRYFRWCRIYGTSGSTVALRSLTLAASFSFTRVCIISFNYHSVRSVFNASALCSSSLPALTAFTIRSGVVPGDVNNYSVAQCLIWRH